jgi:iron complex transport system ATP-binding protein
MGKERWDIFDLQDLLGIVSGDLQHEYTRDISGYEAVLSGFFSSIGIYKNHRVTYEMKCIVQTVMEFLGISHLQDKSISQMSTVRPEEYLLQEPWFMILWLLCLMSLQIVLICTVFTNLEK